MSYPVSRFSGMVSAGHPNPDPTDHVRPALSQEIAGTGNRGRHGTETEHVHPAISREIAGPHAVGGTA
ncbi:hypothetical protein Ait01nite_043060 [Actinoplanes italicus]|uniref:Uncharacterized protein n=2 Tax=Actinoplanes italicus TaxID=113567 RepID=A0A2T0KCX5_9ACTN|nr:hypothetical protein CLV67_10763 [Actinoplanes italicus]GIE31261.1 hypothetical protein Ait01nite_043060 [Actinoplanes italicus]